MALDLNELRELLEAIDQTDIAELTLKSADFELTLRRGVRPAEVVAVSTAPAIAPSPVPTLEPAEPAVTSPTPSPPPPPPSNDRRFAEITSPMVGTFYRAPSPDDPPFVDVGDRIRKGQTVCIIEAMKLMNELETEVAGEIVEILVQNGEPVEYGQLLMRVSPD